jgi:drug/metabolite transporter (DMT)-like permease
MAFVVMKDAIERQSVNNFLFTRFSLAVIVMIALKPSVIRQFDRNLIVRAGSAGIFLGLGYIFQTLGLARTGAAITGFVTGLYVVFTPLLAYFFLKERLTKLIWGCVSLVHPWFLSGTRRDACARKRPLLCRTHHRSR